MRTRKHAERGFTLVEMLMVVFIMGILGASVGLFIANPVRAYFDTIGRAQLTDAADGVLRRVTRDLQTAVPNSPRITSAGGTLYLELVPIMDSGRYRAVASDSAGPGATDPLDVADPTDSSFEVLGRPVVLPASPQLVVLNLGTPDLDLWTGSNRRVITRATGTPQIVEFMPAGPWPADSMDQRFYVVGSAVTYACTPRADGTGTIERFADYPIGVAQPNDPTSLPLSTATRSLMLDKLTGCSIEPGAAMTNLNAMQITLRLTERGETITLYAQVHTSNAP